MPGCKREEVAGEFLSSNGALARDTRAPQATAEARQRILFAECVVTKKVD
eukprot:m.464300 g.464300  ORF g.464300 m.464300 type:complete len:50 (+) comp23432_c0_seq1:15-164(+)